MNLIISAFFSASYLPALASRLFLYAFIIHLAVRRVTSGDAKWLYISANFLMSNLTIEFNAYNMNRKTL